MFALLQRNTSSPSGALRLLRASLDVKCLTNVEFHSPRATGVSVVSRSSSIRIRLPSKYNKISTLSHQQVSNLLWNHWSTSSINCTNVIFQIHLEIDHSYINNELSYNLSVQIIDLQGAFLENRSAIDYGSRVRWNWKIVEKWRRSVWLLKASNKLQTDEFSTSYRWISTNIPFEFTGVKVDR